MTDKRLNEEPDKGNMEKDPQDWVTGEEPMTGAQKSYLKTLSEEAHEPFDETLTKAEASKRIDELQARTGRGAHGRRTLDGAVESERGLGDSGPSERGERDAQPRGER
jgi:hypothetical protein